MKPTSSYTGEQPHPTIPAYTSTALHIPTKPSHGNAIGNSSAKMSKAVLDPVTASPQRGSVSSPSHHSLCRGRSTSTDWHQELKATPLKPLPEAMLDPCCPSTAPAAGAVQHRRFRSSGLDSSVQPRDGGGAPAEPSGTAGPASGSRRHVNFAVEPTDS